MRQFSKLTSFLFVAILAIGAVNAQGIYQNRVELGYQYRMNQSIGYVADVEGVSYASQEAYSIAYFRMMNYGLELGIQLGVLPGEYYVNNNSESSLDVKQRTLMATGILIRHHLLPMMNCATEHIDLYLTSRVGGCFVNGCKFECSVGLGGAYFPIKHIGVFADAQFGRFSVLKNEVHNSDFQLSAGLAYRW